MGGHAWCRAGGAAAPGRPSGRGQQGRVGDLAGTGGRAVPGKAAFEVQLVLGELWEAAALPTQPWSRLAERARHLPVGNPHTEQVALGPLINERQVANVDRIVTSTVASGAELRAGGTYEGLFYAPTVLAGVTTDMPAFREEILGPVAPVTVVADDDEAVAVANDTEYGLVAAIQTGSPDRGRALADRLHTGIVHINDQTLNNDAYAPFGGTGASGNGARFGSQSSWDEFTQWQWVTSRPQAHGFPF
jgi:benzaldehyde dehydrogenase (NAD)